METNLDAKVFPHLFHLFSTLQGMISMASSPGARFESYHQDAPSMSLFQISKIEVCLKGIEVGATAHHQKIVLNTHDFRLVLRDILGDNVTPTAEVDFGKVSMSMYGQYRVHSNLQASGITSSSPKVLTVTTHVEMLNQIQFGQATCQGESAWQMRINMSDTRISCHPTFFEHTASFLTYFLDAYTQSREEFDPDFHMLDTVVQPLVHETAELFKEQSAQNIEELKKNLEAGE